MTLLLHLLTAGYGTKLPIRNVRYRSANKGQSGLPDIGPRGLGALGTSIQNN